MTTILVTRGDLRAAVASVLPHAGTESKDTPAFGRLRFLPVAGGLLVWATDHHTGAVARCSGGDHLDDGLDGWDLNVSAVKAVLAVFRAPKDPDARMMWDDQAMRVELTDTAVVFTEVSDFLDGRSLTVPHLIPAGDDIYPDLPRRLHTLASGRPAASASLRVNMGLLGRFMASAAAWGSLPMITVIHEPPGLLVRCGEALIGWCETSPIDDQDRVTDATRTADWVVNLEPLRRPVKVHVPADVVDDLTRQAADILRNGVGVFTADDFTSLRIVRAPDTTP